MSRSKKKSHFPLNFIDLFCGCGGFSQGLEQAGHRCLLGVDFDENAVASFRKNHKNAIGYQGDIKSLKQAQIEEMLEGQRVHLVVGGPPCQGFSTVGKGDSRDKRNTLFKHFVKVVGWLQPEMILLENVTGILAEKNNKTLMNIFKQFAKLGYDLSAQVLQAQHFGVASQRRRTFIFGIRKDCLSRRNNKLHALPVNSSDFFNELQDFSQNLKTVDQALSQLTHLLDDYYHRSDLAQLKNSLDQKRLACIPEGCGVRYEKDEKKFLPKKLRYGIDWSKIPERRFRQVKLQRLDRKKVAPTIMTGRGSYFHPTENRYLTPREAALLQGFPLDFQFVGSYTSAFRQIGNAVPPQLANQLGQCLSQFCHKFLNKNFLRYEKPKLRINTYFKTSELLPMLDQMKSQAFVYKSRVKRDRHPD